ncbi:ketoacyl-ACP synthase III [bacterium]|nr:ketoacyl-ACP synthase III [bacterium]
MKFEFDNKRITGVLTVVPHNTVKFDDEISNYNFSEKQSKKLKLIMGYEEKRVAPKGVCSSDLCEYGMNYLFDNNLLKREEIDALILVTQSPDYFMPATSNILHGKLGLKKETFCIDISQGCSGFIIGLIQAFMLLEQKNINKVVLLNADVLSPKVSKRDRNSNPLIGDAASITIVEKSNKNEKIVADINFDGLNALCLNIPAGGFRMPSTMETAIIREDEAGNFRSLDNLVMKGDDVFNFVLNKVPEQIENLLSSNGVTKGEIDYFLCHQPNKFMLQKLADKLTISYEKLPNNIVENFGNASGVTIPTCISFNLNENLLNNEYKVCLSGFGIGLTWASMLINIGNFDFCKIIEY